MSPNLKITLKIISLRLLTLSLLVALAFSGFVVVFSAGVGNWSMSILIIPVFVVNALVFHWSMTAAKISS